VCFARAWNCPTQHIYIYIYIHVYCRESQAQTGFQPIRTHLPWGEGRRMLSGTQTKANTQQSSVFLLSPHRTRRLYRTEPPHPPAYPVTASVLRTAIKETRCIFFLSLSLHAREVKHICTTNKSVTTAGSLMHFLIARDLIIFDRLQMFASST
jgi:hypothetical protein